MAFSGHLEASSYVFWTILVFTQIPASNPKTPREKFVELLKLNQMQPRKVDLEPVWRSYGHFKYSQQKKNKNSKINI